VADVKARVHARTTAAHRGRCEVQLEQVVSKFGPSINKDTMVEFRVHERPRYPVRIGVGANGDETTY